MSFVFNSFWVLNGGLPSMTIASKTEPRIWLSGLKIVSLKEKTETPPYNLAPS